MAASAGAFASASATTLRTRLDNLLYDAIQLKAPDWFLHPIFKAVFKNRSIFDEISNTCPITFAPGLAEALSGPSPPTIDYIKSLPEPDVKVTHQLWGIYIHLLECPGRAPRVYIGSGTCVSRISARLKTYEKHDTTKDSLPRYVRLAYRQGFVKTHTALLCWTKTPASGYIPKARQLYLGLEGIFQMLFFAATPTKMDCNWAKFVAWKRVDVEWKHCCSHISLSEAARGDMDASVEELEEMAITKAAYNTTRKRLNKRRYCARHREVLRQRSAANAAKAKAARTYECGTCHLVLADSTALANHLNCGAHKRKVKEVTTGVIPEPSDIALKARAFAAKARAEKRYSCAVCNKVFNIRGHLTKHLNSNKHKRLADAADAELDTAVAECDELSDFGSDDEMDIDEDIPEWDDAKDIVYEPKFDEDAEHHSDGSDLPELDWGTRKGVPV